MLASVPARLALLALISLQAAPQLLAAPFPGIENAAFTSQDLLAEESSPVSSLSQVHVQHNRHRRHHGDGNHGYGHSHHKRHWDHQFSGPGPSCHHHGGFEFEHPHHGPPHHRFEPFPHGFEPFPNTFGPPGHEEHQRPFKAELAPFKDDKERSPLTPQQPSSSSVAPSPAPTVTSPPATTSSTSSSTAAPTPTSSSTEDAPLAIDIRIGLS